MSEDRGMVAREQWEQTQVHRSSTYQCAKCREFFPSPHDLYDHMDAEHPRSTLWPSK